MDGTFCPQVQGGGHTDILGFPHIDDIPKLTKRIDQRSRIRVRIINHKEHLQ